MRRKNENVWFQPRNKMMYSPGKRVREIEEERIRATVCQRMCLRKFWFHWIHLRSIKMKDIE